MDQSFKYSPYPLFRLPNDEDLILFLIKKELQGTKFTNELNRIGFDHSLFSIDLGVVILSLIGFGHRTDELWEWYYEIMDSYAHQVDLHDSRSAHKLSLELYLELRNKLQSLADDVP